MSLLFWYISSTAVYVVKDILSLNHGKEAIIVLIIGNDRLPASASPLMNGTQELKFWRLISHPFAHRAHFLVHLVEDNLLSRSIFCICFDGMGAGNYRFDSLFSVLETFVQRGSQIRGTAHSAVFYRALIEPSPHPEGSTDKCSLEVKIFSRSLILLGKSRTIHICSAMQYAMKQTHHSAHLPLLQMKVNRMDVVSTKRVKINYMPGVLPLPEILYPPLLLSTLSVRTALLRKTIVLIIIEPKPLVLKQIRWI